MPEGRLKRTRQNYCEHKHIANVHEILGNYLVCLDCNKVIEPDFYNLLYDGIPLIYKGPSHHN